MPSVQPKRASRRKPTCPLRRHVGCTLRWSPCGLLSRSITGSGMDYFASAFLPPDFFAIDGPLGRRHDAQPNGISLDRDHGDLQSAVGHQNSFAKLATEDEHESSSLKLTS